MQRPDREKEHLYLSRPQYVEAVQWTGTSDSLLAIVEAQLGGHVLPPEHEGGSLMLRAGKDGAQEWVPVPVGHWIVHQPGDISDVWPVEDAYFRAKYEAAQSGSSEQASPVQTRERNE
jgi:hypothetical protein